MFKRSISNLAWGKEHDTEMYKFLSENNFEGIEIAPSRVFGENPYIMINEAKDYKKKLSEKYNLEISSIQSIWYGRKENIFISNFERNILLEYTKKAIDFAAILNCKNIVFGCPKNRNIPSNMNVNDCYKIATDFFSEIGEYANNHNTCLSIEANPAIYNTNFLTSTSEAISIIKDIDSKGIKLNLDTGTMIYNKEMIDLVKDNNTLINHIHISEPFLKPISYNQLQNEIINNFRNNDNYSKYISIEISLCENVSLVKECLLKLSEYK